MTAAVTPLEARCEVCKDTGSKSGDLSGDLDCTACDAATERMAMRVALDEPKSWDDSSLWRAYQLGKAAATPVVPVAAQPVVQVPQLPFVIAPESLAALRRFYECALDGEGHDVAASTMKVLEGIGLVQRRRGSYYETTEFGLAVLDGKFAAPHIEAQPAGEVVIMPQRLTPGMKSVLKEVAPKWNAESIYANLYDAAAMAQGDKA